VRRIAPITSAYESPANGLPQSLIVNLRKAVRISIDARRVVPAVALAVGISIALPACAGTSGAAATGAPGTVAAANSSAAADNPACSAVEKEYPLLAAGTLPEGDGANQWDTFATALGQALPSGDVPTGINGDVFNLETDATGISDDISQSYNGRGSPQDYQQFDADLKTVGKDCGTTFKPLPASLTGAP
jgi:hypothetical protein